MADVVEHNEGDLTAILDAGVPLAAAQARFAQADQMLALDPPLGPDRAATIGGVVATGDSGPLRHRYGAPRDLVVGMTMALADGTVAKAGGKVIKNVAGYDLAKLFAGSFGTLGADPPRRRAAAPAGGYAGDPAVRGRRAAEDWRPSPPPLSHAHLEMEALDVSWGQGAGAVLARFAGAAAYEQAEAAAELAPAGELVDRRRGAVGAPAGAASVRRAVWW